jgi:hypothetical protein
MGELAFGVELGPNIVEAVGTVRPSRRWCCVWEWERDCPGWEREMLDPLEVGPRAVAFRGYA